MTQKTLTQFDENYTVVAITSAVMFSFYFIIGVFVLNLTYLPKSVSEHGALAIFVIIAYYILTSLVLLPVLILINSVLSFFIKKIVKYAYSHQPLVGFILYPAIMTIIPIAIVHFVIAYFGKISSFDYCFLYFNTWISAVLQYVWILKNIKENPELLNPKQAEFIKSLDRIDYF